MANAISRAIDIHHHYVPMQLIEETRRHGESFGVSTTELSGSHALAFAGSKPHRLQPPIFDVEGHLNVMERGQVRMAALEANTNSLGYRLSGEQGETWSKLYNECVNDLIQRHPDRFAGTATVPLQDPRRAAKVLEHAVSRLEFRAAFIGTHANGQYHNNINFDGFWAKAQELDVLVVIHP